jgi:lysophospholipase L1-like esterase
VVEAMGRFPVACPALSGNRFNALSFPAQFACVAAASGFDDFELQSDFTVRLVTPDHHRQDDFDGEDDEDADQERRKNSSKERHSLSHKAFIIREMAVVVKIPITRYNRLFMQINFARHSLLLLVPFFVSVCSSTSKGVIVICAGDSITAEAYPHFLQRLFNTAGIRARVLNFGRSGNTSGEYLGFLERNKERLNLERPDFVLLQLGTNDVRVDADSTETRAFAENMKRIIEIFRAFRSRSGKTPRLLLGTVPPAPPGPLPFSPESTRRVSEEINPALRAIAGKERILLVDHYSLFFREPGLLPGVHPSREGYRRLAENWFIALKPVLP